MLGFVTKLIGLALRDPVRSLNKDRKQVYARGLLHLFKSFDRDHRRQGLAFALNDKLVMPKRHPIQEISKPLTDLKGRHCFNHKSPHPLQLV
ncbi:hypothetical protein COMA2_60007 [Candidatus Nitrospira nitrificans]|uniref:Uncharacterized protein n=1 Tax=Candidatus Nitrospira nitrificans TaxID=1742973 RepID=A0A0S4LQJ6_9BACT|nr:hypothetical protein COMA2_60007 [Candidatus Nitrospira nitrificans]